MAVFQEAVFATLYMDYNVFVLVSIILPSGRNFCLNWDLKGLGRSSAYFGEISQGNVRDDD